MNNGGGRYGGGRNETLGRNDGRRLGVNNGGGR